jgi:hypothetical protein
MPRTAFSQREKVGEAAIQCGKEGCACAVYPTFHDAPELSDYYPTSGLMYETRGDGLTEVRVSVSRRFNVTTFEDGDGSWPVMTGKIPEGVAVTVNGVPTGAVQTFPTHEADSDK